MDHLRVSWVGWVAALACITLMGCGDDESGGSGDTTTGGTTSGDTRPEGLRLFYALATPAAIDMTLIDNDDPNNTHDITGVAMNTVSPYSDVPAGNYRAIFFEAGTRTPLSSVSVDDITIAAGTPQTLILSRGTDGEAKDQIVPDDLVAPGENSSRYRFIYRGTGTNIDVYSDDGVRIQGASSLALGQLTLYSDIPGGSYNFEVRREGLQEALHQIEVPLKPSEVYTIFIIGEMDPNEDGNTSDNTITHVLATDWSLD